MVRQKVVYTTNRDLEVLQVQLFYTRNISVLFRLSNIDPVTGPSFDQVKTTLLVAGETC